MSASLAMTRVTKKRRGVPDISMEERAERLVPAIQRAPVVRKRTDGTVETLRPAIVAAMSWDDPEDINERSKTPRQVMGFRRIDPLVASAGQEGPITRMHLSAVERYRNDFERGCLGARPGYEKPEAGTGGSVSSIAPSEMQLAALDRYRIATKAVGLRARWVLVEIVLGMANITEAGERRGLTKRTAPGYVAGALDRLQDAYDEIGDEGSSEN